MFVRIILCVLIDLAFGYGFFGHDMIAQSTWNQLSEKTKYWICSDYDVCNLEDFQTISALPDLLKHEKKFIKYFNLHFYNNLGDDPPSYCRINVSDAFNENQPNILKAVKTLIDKLDNGEKFSFIEFAYLIHLLADLHQPFHITNYERGGMKRKLCYKNSITCWSLHALWDAEILKSISEIELNFNYSISDSFPFDVKDWALQLNQLICKIYDYPKDKNFGLEEYVDKFKFIALFLVEKAAKNTAVILNSKKEKILKMSSTTFNNHLEFEREIASINSELKNKAQLELSEELTYRFNNLQKQFKVKSSFLSGYQLKQLREKMNILCGFFNKNVVVEHEELIFENDENMESSTRFKNFVTNENFEVKRRLIANLKNENISENVEGDLLIENLFKAAVNLSGEINSLKIRNVTESRIELNGICRGSVYIESFNGGSLLIAGDQIRIHDSSNVDIILYSKNSCILENCESLRFYPNKAAAKSLGNCENENYWRCVQDFGFNTENSFKLIDLDDEL